MAVLPDLAGVLHAVQRRLAGERSTRLAQHGCECRIMPQRVVIDEILATETEAEEALTQQIGQRMLDRVGDTKIGEAGRQSFGQSQPPVGTCE